MAAGGDIRKTIDNVATLVQRVNSLTYSDVLVGVPSSKAGRKEGEITNASLAYIHEHGSPLHNIPERPFLHPGIKRIRAQAIAMMKQGAKDALSGAAVNVDQVLNKVGILARNSVVQAITDPNPPFVPLGANTIRARLRKTAGGRRKLRQAAKIRRESDTGRSILTNDAALARATAGMEFKPLIDTGQLRAAITYVIVRR
jgi:hypothetical protein